MLQSARNLFNNKSHLYSIPNLEGFACVQYYNAFKTEKHKFTNQDILNFAYACYVSGKNYEVLKTLRSFLLSRLIDRKKIERDFLLFLFDASCRNNIRKDIDIEKYINYIDSSFRVEVIAYYLIENYRVDEAKLFLKKKKHVLKEKKLRILNSYIYAIEHSDIFEILYDKSFIKARYYSNNNYNKPLIITFDPIDSHKRTESFGVNFCINNGYDVLHFALASRTQYQGLDRQIFKEVAKNIIKKYDRTVCYGSSLGGHAALYFSDIFNSDVLAFSPLNSSHPKILKKFPQANNMSILDYTHDYTKTAATSGRVMLTLDLALEKDLYFYKEILSKKFHDVDVFEMAYTGHPILTILLKTNQLQRVVIDAFQKRTLNIDRQLIKEHSYHYYLMFLFFKNNNQLMAIESLKKAISFKDSDMGFYIQKLKDIQLLN